MKDKSSPPSRDAYYRAAGDWANARRDALSGSLGLAWIFAAVATVIALLEAGALVAVLPLETVAPYTLPVDRHTGIVRTLTPPAPASIAPDAALTQSALAQYVLARESFNLSALQAAYRKVALWSDASVRSAYVAEVQAASPTSPLARYPRTTLVDAQVKSVSPLGGNAAMIRFDTRRRDADGPAYPLQSWIAVVRYRFSTEGLTAEDRYVNPLGFQVTYYVRNAEGAEGTVRATPPVPAPSAPPAIEAKAQVRPSPRAPQAPRPQPSAEPGIEITL